MQDISQFISLTIDVVAEKSVAAVRAAVYCMTQKHTVNSVECV